MLTKRNAASGNEIDVNMALTDCLAVKREKRKSICGRGFFKVRERERGEQMLTVNYILSLERLSITFTAYAGFKIKSELSA